MDAIGTRLKNKKALLNLEKKKILGNYGLFYSENFRRIFPILITLFVFLGISTTATGTT